MTIMLYIMGLSMIILLLGIIATIGYVEDKMKTVDGVINTVDDLNIALDQWKIFLEKLTNVEKDKTNE